MLNYNNIIQNILQTPTKYPVLICSLIITGILTYDGINKTNSENPEEDSITPNVIGSFLFLIIGFGYFSYKSVVSTPSILFSLFSIITFIIVFICIYLFVRMDIKTYLTVAYLSGIILTLVFIVALAVIFYMIGNLLKSFTGWSGFIINFIFYIPCLLISFLQYIISEFKLTTSPVIILFMIELLLLLSYLYVPNIITRVANKDGVLIHNSNTLNNGDIQTQDTFYLNSQNTFSFDNHIMPDKNFQIAGNSNDTHFHNYAISMWTYVNAHGSNKLAYNTESVIFDYGDRKPKVTYYNGDDQDTRDKYRIYFTNNTELNNDGNTETDFNEYYEMKLPLQRWNNLVFNFSSTHADLFVNGHLERTFSFADGKMPTFANTDVITTGTNNGLHGAISNIRYYTKNISKHKITSMYNIFMKKTPPTFNM